MNPKLFISNYFDSIVNLIDIHTEEELEKAKDMDFEDMPFEKKRDWCSKYWETSDLSITNTREQIQETEKHGIMYFRDPYSNKCDFTHQPLKHITSRVGPSA